MNPSTPNSKCFGRSQGEGVSPLAKVGICSLSECRVPFTITKTSRAEVMPCTTLATFLRSLISISRQHNHSARHAQVVVKSAEIRVSSRRRECDTEPCWWSDWPLQDTWLIFE